MGQVQSFDVLPNAVESVQEEVVRQTRNLTEISSITYEQFSERVSDLNNLAQELIYPNGEQLMFCIKRGSDSSILWKATVKIACILYNPKEKAVSSFRLLNLNQFLKIFQTIRNEINTIELAFKEKDRVPKSNLPSTLIDTVNNAYTNCDSLMECCICLERKPDILLACSHSYCQQCIDEWSTNNKTCPVCRTVTQDKDDCWVLSEAPAFEEISQHISTSLKQLLDS